MSRIGFIGYGIMGQPMAENLLAAGHSLVLSKHYKVPPANLLGKNTTVCKTPKEVAEASDFIITMVPDTPQAEEVLLGEQGVIHGLSSGKTVIDMSSICPIATKDIAKEIKQGGAEFLDAPVSGGEVGAKAGSLTIMVGGSQSAFDNALPLFEIMGTNITLVGDNSAGQTCKVANQIIVALNIEAVSEALLFASKAGANPAKVREALMGGFASSKVLEVHGERMVKGAFNPGFKIKLHQKDLNLALNGARSLNISLPNTATAQELYNSCSAQGGDEWDHSAMIKALESMANHSIRN